MPARGWQDDGSDRPQAGLIGLESAIRVILLDVT
jgi:hypothetical protein